MVAASRRSKLSSPTLVRLIVAATIALIVGVGCGVGGEDSQDDAHSHELSAVLADWEAALHDDDFLRTRWADRQNFVADCMASHGFTYRQRPIPDAVSGAPGFGVFFYLTLTEEQAAEHGLGLVPDEYVDEDDLDAMTEFHMEGNQPSAYHFAMDGIETEDGGHDPGCSELAAEAVGALSAGQALSYLPHDQGGALEDRWGRFHADPDTLKIKREWSQCMATAGLGGYDSPTDFSELLEELWEDVPSTRYSGSRQEAQATVDAINDRERAVAVEWARCLNPHREAIDELLDSHLRTTAS